MGVRQIVQTNKRIVFLAAGDGNTVGVTASAFCNYSTTDGRIMGEGSGITNGTAAISRIVSGSNAFSVAMGGETLFTGVAAGEYIFERWTLKPVSPNGNMTINAGAGTVIVEVVL